MTRLLCLIIVCLVLGCTSTVQPRRFDVGRWHFSLKQNDRIEISRIKDSVRIRDTANNWSMRFTELPNHEKSPRDADNIIGAYIRAGNDNKALTKLQSKIQVSNKITKATIKTTKNDKVAITVLFISDSILEIIITRKNNNDLLDDKQNQILETVQAN